MASARSKRSTPPQGSKPSIVIDLLARKRGAGLEELASAVGWLPHTTRAALTGFRKRGYAIERELLRDSRLRYRPLFEAVQTKLKDRAVARRLRLSRSPSFLSGLLYDDRGNLMSPSHANKKGVR